MKYEMDGSVDIGGIDSRINGVLYIDERNVCRGQLKLKQGEKNLDYNLEGRVSLKDSPSAGKKINFRDVELALPEKYSVLELKAQSLDGSNTQDIWMLNSVPLKGFGGTYYSPSGFMGEEAVLTLSSS